MTEPFEDFQVEIDAALSDPDLEVLEWLGHRCSPRRCRS